MMDFAALEIFRAVAREGSVTRYGVVTKDGVGEAVEGLVLGLAGANAQKVVEGVTKKLEDMGAEVNNLGSQDFSKLIDAEAKRWAEAVKISGAKVE